ncbi:MAG: DNA-directed RNA polymerase subunit omega [Acidobacteria bacterium]|nr:DNA-directed RNA polymerase subunit omega [Acidobacteriota bacterium]MBI3428142.1 DNA-directed RNA polymerase subunit omega [Acidobacteriota bacterium]
MQPHIIENKYRKVLVASQRARQLEKGARPLVQVGNNKVTLIAVQEVEAGLIGYELLPSTEEVAAGRA